MRLGWLLALMLLAGCAARQDPKVAQAECVQATNNDPDVKRLMLVGLTDGGQAGFADAYGIARYKAMQACLRSKGLAPPGGVMPVQRSGFMYDVN